MPPFPQSIMIAVEFETEHKPGSPLQLHTIAKEYLKAKGVTLDGNVITI